MASVETGQSRSHARAGKKHKRKRRLAVRIDMTPMVDVAFLLLTFFMLTTVFSKPQTMELNLPPSDTKVEVAESNLLILRVAQDGSIYWNLGSDKPVKVAFKELRPILLQKSQANPKLITLLKVDREGTYNMMVDIMDELNLANITRFSLAPLLPADQAILKKVAS